MLQGVRRPPQLGHLLAHDARHEQPAVLEVVRRRAPERQLQLRRPPPGEGSQQSGAHLRPRARAPRDPGDHLPGALPAGQRVRRAPPRVLRGADRGPGHLPPADAPRAAGLDARLRPPRGHPLRGVRGVQRDGLRRPDRRFGKPHPGDDRRLLPQRRAHRPQGEGRRGNRRRPQPRHRDRQGARLATASGRVRLEEPDGRRPGLLRRRALGGLPRPARRPRLDAGRGAAVPHVHQRHDRPPEGLPAQHRRLSRLRRGDVQVLPGHPPGGHVLVPCRHRVDHRALLHRLRAPGARGDERDVRRRAHLPGRGASVADRGAPRGEHLPHGAHDDPHAAQARPRRAARSTTTTSST